MNRTLISNVMRALTFPFTRMPGRSFRGPLPALSGPQADIANLLNAHVDYLASTIGERHIGRYEALCHSVDYISSAFESAGYTPRLHGYELLGKTVYNIEATLKGTSPRVLVVGAHYDSIPGCAGADDNASGTASVLALAKLLREFEPHDTIRFVAFANEEHPCLPATTMGSYQYAKECRRNGDKDLRMMVLEMLGFFKHEENTQHYPSPFNLVYPTTGDFLGFVGNWKSRQFLRECIYQFRKHGNFPSDGVAAPDFFKDIGRSDHWGFWEHGYEAIMITDTANFRNPHYHTEFDTPDTVDYESMSRVVTGIAAMVKEISVRKSHLKRKF